MLFLLFQLGKERYALDAGQVSEVLPLLDVKEIPQAPLGVAGVFDFRGVAVPVIDLSLMAYGRPAPHRWSTRLIVAHYPDGGGEKRLLGLVVEKATEAVRFAPEDFVETGVTSERAPYLGPVATDARGMVQRIDVSKLLPASVREVLFAGQAERR